MDSVPSGSSTTTGFRDTPSVDRIATWGWLMIGPGDAGAERAGVGDGERAAADVVEAQPLGPGPVGHVADPPGHAPQVQLLGVVDHRDDQALVVEVDGDAEVDVVVDDRGRRRPPRR